MSPKHGCLAVGMRGHLLGYMQPMPRQDQDKAVSLSCGRAPLGGAFIRMGTTGWTLGMDVFLV